LLQKTLNTTNTNSSTINDETKPQINSIQSFVVTTNKLNNNVPVTSNLSSTQISNFSNLNLTCNSQINGSMLNQNTFLNSNLNNASYNIHIGNKAQNSSVAEDKMQIDDESSVANQNTILIKKESANFVNSGFDLNSNMCDFFNPQSKITTADSNMKYGNQDNLNPQPQLVDDYLEEIFTHLKEIEFNITTNPFYMKSQNDVNEKMRAILIDWLVEVHLKFKLVPETLFLTVNLIDRYLDKKVIMRNRLQLVGVTAMLIACKYEEIYAPEVRDFVYITDKAYTKEEIFQMENDMLSILEYNITVPSSFRYMEVLNRYLKLEENAIMFCRYLLELFLIEYKMIKYNPSLLAAATMYITLKITKKSEAEKVMKLTCYSDEILKECAKDICGILDNVEKNSLQAVKKKFSLPKFMEVAKIKFN
jgi:cyclin B